MKKPILLALFLGASLSLFSQSEHHLDIYFEEGSSNISADSRHALEHIMEVTFPKRIFKKIVVESFLRDDLNVVTSSTNLTNQQIETVRSWLESYDLEIDKVIHYQEADHIYFDFRQMPNLNFIRLVYHTEIKINSLADEEEIEAIISVSDKSTASSVIIETNEKNQIDPRYPTRLVLENGGILAIPSNAFQTQDGQIIYEKLSIQTMEIFDPASAVLAGATTNLDDGYLESRGMLKLEAFDQAGNPLQLVSGKSIEISIPAYRQQPLEDGFQIYKGTVKDDGLYQWRISESNVDNTANALHFNQRSRWRHYHWKKIKNEHEITRIETQRDEIIAQWKQDGYSKKVIKAKLKRYQNRYRRKHNYIRRKYRRSTKRTRSSRDYTHLKKSMILAKAKYRWHHAPTKNRATMVDYYTFRSFNLGLFNIDRFYKTEKPLEHLLVHNEKGRNVKLLFESTMVLIEGKQKKDQTVFKNIPKKEKVILISSTKIGENQIEFGYRKATVGDGEVQIDNYELLSVAAYKEKVKRLMR